MDRETLTYYDLVILVSDSGTPQLSAQINIAIIVTPINEFPPNFTKNGFYNVTINEDTAVGTTLVTVTAHDSDSGKQGDIMFTMVSGNEQDMFQLGVKTGSIVLKRALDYEMQPEYSLVVRATDGAASGLVKYTDARVNVTVIDLNDNAPICIVREKVIALLETTIKGTVIFSANCSDSDSNSNALLSYQLVNEQGKFNVTSSGDIMLINNLDIESTSLYNLVVMVTDAGSPTLSCNITLTVSVRPVNEYVPTFAVGDFYQLDVLENITLGKTLLS